MRPLPACPAAMEVMPSKEPSWTQGMRFWFLLCCELAYLQRCMYAASKYNHCWQHAAQEAEDMISLPLSRLCLSLTISYSTGRRRRTHTQASTVLHKRPFSPLLLLTCTHVPTRKHHTHTLKAGPGDSHQTHAASSFALRMFREGGKASAPHTPSKAGQHREGPPHHCSCSGTSRRWQALAHALSGSSSNAAAATCVQKHVVRVYSASFQGLLKKRYEPCAELLWEIGS